MPLKIVVYEAGTEIIDAFKTLKADHDVYFVEGLLTETNADEHSDADILCIDQSVLKTPILSQLKQLRMISLLSTGWDHIDVDFCKNNGITVCNIPGYAGNAVAEHTFALLLNIFRHMETAIQYTRKTRFCWEGLKGFELQDKTMAVIGTGAIGKRTAEIARGFNMNVIAFDFFPNDDWANKNGTRYVDFNNALSDADVISLNIPAANEQGPLLGEAQFRIMKTGVVIINTARGELIDSQSLLLALDSGKVAAAGLDVLPYEHFIREKDKDVGVFFKDLFDSKMMLANQLLCQHPNVIVTPHIGWFSFEAVKRSFDLVLNNIRAYISGQPENVVVTNNIE